MKCVLPANLSAKKAIFFALAFLQTMFGALTLVFHEEIFAKLLNSQLVVKEGTEAFNAWVSTPIPVYTKFYFFSILNPDDFLVNHAKPVLVEKGPYTFREKEEKVGLVWNANHTVSYRRKKTWWFEPELSVGPLSDTVMTLNLPMVGASDAAREDFFMQWGISNMFATIESQLFLNRTVGELLFDGYNDELITMGEAMTDSSIPMDKFGWFYKRNGTTWSDGDLTMHTGEDDISRLGKIASWNYNTRTKAFPGECGQLRGSSDGLMAPGSLAMKDEFQIWSTDICRPLTFSRFGSSSSAQNQDSHTSSDSLGQQQEEETMHGIPVDRFQLAASNFANTTVCPDNHCYNNNLPTGVQNVTRCRMNSPAFVSRPHFYQADPFYVDQFQMGMEPNAARHDSYFVMEPKTSIPLKIAMRLQLNILIDPNPGIQYVMHNVPRTFFPVLWFESEAELPESMSGQLLLLVNLPVIMKSCGGASIVLGLGGMLTTLFVLLRFRRSNKRAPSLAEVDYSAVAVKEGLVAAAAASAGVVGADYEAEKPILKVPLVQDIV